MDQNPLVQGEGAIKSWSLEEWKDNQVVDKEAAEAAAHTKPVEAKRKEHSVKGIRSIIHTVHSRALEGSKRTEGTSWVQREKCAKRKFF